MSTPAEVRDGDVAIVGIACRAPGARDVHAFWRNLEQGVDSLAAIAPDAVESSPVHRGDPHGADFVAAGHVLEDVDLFDAAFFGYAPAEAERMDPQQRLLLECAWHAFEDAGYDPRAVPGRVAVYAGTGLNTYWLSVLDHADTPEHGFAGILGNDKDFAATRIAYKLGLTGEAVSVQTACSTGLVAVHLACQSLLSGQSDVALAGAAAILLPQRTGHVHRDGMILSPDGRCRAFDRDAQGFAPGRAVACVVLKPLAAALADGDHVWAVVRGTAINNDGRDKVGYTAPSVDAQAAVIAMAQEFAGVTPDTIGYVEAHGTATALGDVTEVAALSRVFRARTERRQFCALGSVKTNIGHTDVAAGLMGLIKAALALHHGRLPPSLHFSAPNPRIELAASPFFVPTVATDWPATGAPRRAGVSSFGIGGTNAHAVLEEAPPVTRAAERARPAYLLPLSARTPAALRSLVERYVAYLAAPAAPLADVCLTASAGRTAHVHRLAVRGASAGELRDALAAFLGGRDDDRLVHGTIGRAATRVGVLVPAAAAASLRPLRAVVASLPAARAALAALRAGDPGPAALAPDGDPTEAFDLQLAVAEAWRRFGLHPACVAGTGSGALVAGCLAGVLDTGAVRAALRKGGGDAPALPLVARDAPETVTWLAPSGEEIDRAAAARIDVAALCAAAGDGIAAQLGARCDVVVTIGRAPAADGAAAVASNDGADGDRRAGGGDGDRGEVREAGGDGDDATHAWRALLSTLARIWVAGVAVDWGAFAGGGDVRRCSLPGYPFERRRHWLEPRSAALRASSSRGDANAHPGPTDDGGDAPTTATPASAPQVVEHWLDAAFDPLLGEHRLDGTPLLPAAALVPLVLDAAARGGAAGDVAELTVAAPLAAGRDGRLGVRVTIEPAVRGRRRFHVAATSGDAPWSERASGELLAAEPPHADAPLDVARLRAALPPAINGDDAYAAALGGGVVHGPALRAIEWLAGDGCQVLALLRRPARTAARALDGAALDPVLLDGTLKAIAAKLGADGALGGGHARYLPFALGRVRVVRALPEVVHCHARRRDDPSAARATTPAVLRWDARLHDADGNLCALLDDVVLKRAGDAATPVGETIAHEAELDPERDPRMAEHLLAGVPVLPAAAILELALTAARRVCGAAVAGLAGVELATALRGRERRVVQVALLPPRRPGAAPCIVVRSALPGERTTVEHARATIVLAGAAGDDAAVPLPFALDALRARCTDPVERDAFAARVRALGVENGPVYRCLESLHTADGAAVARLRLPEAARALPPPEPDPGVAASLLHGAMGVLTALALARDAGSDDVHVPFAIERMHVLAPLVDEVDCYARARPAPSTGGAVPGALRFDAVLADRTGRPLVVLDGVAKKRVPRAHALRAGAAPAFALGAALRAPDGSLVCEAECVAAHHPLLLDHAVHGSAILPGAAWPALVLTAAQRALDAPCSEIAELVMQAPLTAGSGARALRVRLAPGGSAGRRRFRVASVAAGGVEVEHASGTLGGAAVAAPPPIDLAACRAGFGERLEHGALYAAMRTRGIVYGPSYASLDLLESDGRAALGRLRRAPATDAGYAFALDPVVLDAATQCLALLFPAAAAEGGATVLPVAIADLAVFGSSTRAAYCHATRDGDLGQALARGLFAFTLQVLDRDGAVLVRFRLWEKKVAASAALAPVPLVPVPRAAVPAARPRAGATLHATEWRATALPARRATPPRTWLVLAAADGVGAALVARLRARGERCVRMAFARDAAADDGTLVVDPADPGSYRSAIRALAERGELPGAVLHAWSCDTADGRLESERALLASQLRGAASLLLLAQALLDARRAPLDLWLVTSRAQSLPGRWTAPEGAPLIALGRVLASEHREVACHLVDVEREAAPAAAWADVVLDEIAAHRPGVATEVAYADGTRRTRALAPLAPHDARATALPLRERGVYLVTGGRGGIGLEIARWLARRAPGARLVLVGRSAPSAEVASALRALAAEGAEVVTPRADVADPRALAAVVADVECRFGRIDGVVHAAGIARPGGLRRKSLRDLLDVLRPKVGGAWALDRALAGRTLDFCVHLSSLVTEPGYANAGNAGYAAANAFLDAVPSWGARRSAAARVVAVRFGPWAEAGMATSDVLRREAKRMGIDPMASEEALAGLEAALVGDREGYVVAGLESSAVSPPVDGEVLRAPAAPSPAAALAPPPASAGAPVAPALLAGVQRLLADEIARALGTTASEVPPQTNFQEIGIDSLMAVQVRRALEERLDVKLDPLLLFEYPSLAELAAEVARTHGPALASLLGETTAATPALAPAEVPRTIAGDDQAVEQELRDAPVAPVRDGAEAPPRRDGSVAPAVEPLPPRAPAAAAGVPRQAAVAIVGMACRFPGAPDLDAYWSMLRAGRSGIGPVPEGRWRLDDFVAADDPGRDATALAVGGYLHDVDRFDPLCFGVAPREARLMDPQQRLLLETVWQVLEHAGHAGDGRHRTGVFVGFSATEYGHLVARAGLGTSEHAGTGNAPSILANRISYLLDLAGPSLAVDTACSSSLVAVDLACRYLELGLCEAAIAAGVNLILTPLTTLGFLRAGMLSRDGRCKTFDRSADGYVRGEGVGAVLLKPLARALADGDRIWAVIRGSAVNHDGHAKVGLTAPSPRAQQDVLVDAYARAGVDPATVSYVEAHGTGTTIGDAIELKALTAAFRRTTSARGFCALGSVKTNLGHLEPAAGIAALIKTALALAHREIPPTLNVEQPNPDLGLGRSPFTLALGCEPWQGPEPLRAGVSSFGFGGVNAHVVLEAAPPEAPRAVVQPAAPLVLALSARSERALVALAGRYRAHLRAHPELVLGDVCFTAACGRHAMRHRLAIVFGDRQQLLDRLRLLELEHDRAALVESEVYVGDAARAGGANDAAPARPADASAAARAFVAGAALDWTALVPAGAVRRVPLPTYPFERERYWIEAPRAAAEHGGQGAGVISARPAPRTAIELRHATDPVALPGSVALYVPRWQRAPLPPVPLALPEDGVWCVLGDGGPPCARLVAELRARRQRVLEVERGARFARLGADRFAVRPGDAGDHAALFAALAATDGPLGGVVHLWSAAAETDLPRDEAALAAAVDATVGSVLLCAQGLVDDPRRARVSNGAFRPVLLHAACGDDGALGRALARAIGGLLRVVAGECRQLVARSVALDGTPEGDAAALVLRELGAGDDVAEVRYVGGERHALDLAPAPGTDADALASLAAVRGPVLVAGGLGAAGLEVARMLARRGTAPIVLLSRRGAPAAPAERAALAALRRDGAAVETAACDVADPSALRALLADLRRRHGPLRGLVHAAGVLRDERLRDKTLGSFADVLRPKVTGTWALARTLGGAALDGAARDGVPRDGEALDFVVLFSSLASVDGLPGQADYAAANAFLDAVAEDGARWFPGARRVLSIGWGRWAGGGLVANPASDDPGATSGIPALDPEDAGRALEVALARAEPHLFVVPRALRIAAQRSAAREHDPDVLDQAPVAPPSRDGLVELLAERVADALELPRVHVDGRASFRDLGIDSLIAVGLVRELEEDAGCALRPTLFFDYPCVEALADHLWTGHADAVARLLRRPAGRAPAGRRAAPAPAAPADEPDGGGARAGGDAPDGGRVARLARTLAPRAAARAAALGRRVAELVPRMDDVAAALVAEALATLGWSAEVGRRETVGALCARLGIVEPCRDLAERLLDLLATHGVLRRERDDVVVLQPPRAATARRLLDELRALAPEFAPDLTLLERAGRGLAAVLRGDASALSLLCPGGSLELLDAVYGRSPLQALFNELAAEAVAAWRAQSARRLRILEVGAGTGGTTAAILAACPQGDVAYVHSDVSRELSRHARAKLGARDDVEFRLLDLERAPEPQGFVAGSFDVLVAANVLHATHDLHRSLHRVASLLRPGGLLVLLEATRAVAWADVVFGGLHGWRARREDDLCCAGPLLDARRWRTLLRASGFGEVASLPEASPASDALGAVLLLASRAATPTEEAVTTRAPAPGQIEVEARQRADDLTAAAPGARAAARPGDVAIVGFAGRFPGARSADELWQGLIAGRDAIAEVPAERWDVARYFDPDPRAPGKTYSRWGGYLDEVELFDPTFFGISPREAELMDPQQRLLLEVAWEAIEHAGHAGGQLTGSRTAVFVGGGNGEYGGSEGQSDFAAVESHSVTGGVPCILANRLSYALDLKGPSVTVDTASSSSLVALHLACQSLATGESTHAIAAGVHLALTPRAHVLFSKVGALARDGRCKAFDERADGFTLGEGAVAVLLKPLARALADGDTVHAVLKGSAVNQDGRTAGLSAPSGPSQTAVVRAAWRAAGVRPESVSYVEAHGTGTALGDPIELHALAEAFRGAPAAARCAFGSIKTNIGHLEYAAGLAGLVKVVLALRHRRLPGLLHFTRLNPLIALAGSPLEPCGRARAWDGPAPLRAGVSSFGFGGTNAHVVVEEPPARPRAAAEAHAMVVLALSAKSAPALRELAARHAAHLRALAPEDLADACFTAATGRATFRHRLAIRGASPAELAARLDAFAAGRTSPADDAIAHGEVQGRRPPAVRWRFAPLEGDAARVAAACALDLPAWRAAHAAYGGARVAVGDRFPDDEGVATERAALAVQIACGRLLRLYGVRADASAGEGVGEIARRCVFDELAAAELDAAFADRARAGGDGAATRAPAGLQLVFASRSASDGDTAYVLPGDGDDLQRSLLDVVARAWVAGSAIDWHAVLGGAARRRVPLPTYPFQRRRCWIDGASARDAAPAVAPDGGAHALNGRSASAQR